MKYAIYLLLSFFIIIAGCSKNNEILVTVDIDKYTINDFKDRLQFAPADDSLKKLEKINEFVNQILTIKAAREKGYENDPVVQAAYETNRKEVIWYGFYDEQLVKKIKIPDVEIRKIYEQMIDQYHLAQIVVSNESLAQYIGKELKRGVPFESLLKFSLDTLTQNGDIGSFGALSIPPELLEPLKRTKVGKATEPILFGDHFYILKIIEYKKLDTPKYSSVKENIKNRLMRDKLVNAVEKYIQELHKEAKIEYNQKGLDALIKPDSLITPEDLNTWVVKKYDTAFVFVKTIRDAVLNQYRRSFIEPKILIDQVLFPDLLYDKAIKVHAENHPEIKKRLKFTLEMLLYQKLYSDVVLDKASVESLEVVSYYKQYRDKYKDKKFDAIYTQLKIDARNAKVDSLRKSLFNELRLRYNPMINDRAIALLLKEEK